MNTEQKMIAALGGIVDIQKAIVGMGSRETLGARVANDDKVKQILEKGADFARIDLTPTEFKAAIINDHLQNNPLVSPHRPQLPEGAVRRLSLRQLLRAGTTKESAVEYPTESTFSNTAGPQVGGSPEQFENVALTESGASFSLSFKPVVTLGHTATVSKNVLQDSSVLNAFLNSRLMYGLKLVEEGQILNGSGANGELDGLLNNATSYSVQSPNLANEVDILRDCIRQIEASDYLPDAIILNPTDWHSIEVRKSGSSDDEYVSGDPRHMGTPTLWGLPVVVTNSIAAGTALIGDFKRCAALFDREQASIEISKYHGSNFTKGMVTLRALERIGLVVTNSLALVTASI